VAVSEKGEEAPEVKLPEEVVLANNWEDGVVVATSGRALALNRSSNSNSQTRPRGRCLGRPSHLERLLSGWTLERASKTAWMIKDSKTSER
jgi:hypothetical protein